MGGRLFDGNKRLNYIGYRETEQEVRRMFSFAHFLKPRDIEDKASFGDLDLLTDSNNINKIMSIVKQLKYPNHKNGNVFSFQTPKKFQVDIIFLPKDKLEFACNYFSFGDTGNLIGRMVKPYDVKLSFKGLYYVYRIGNEKHEVLLEDDWYKMLSLFGLDQFEYMQGFNNKEQAYNWVTKSPYFDYRRYDFANLSYHDRTRDRKRAFYREFLEYLYYKKIEIVPDENLKFPYDKFPQIKKLIDDVDEKFYVKQQYKHKMNGSRIMELTKLDGKELGLFMSKLKELKSQDDILLMSDEKLINLS